MRLCIHSFVEYSNDLYFRLRKYAVKNNVTCNGKFSVANFNVVAGFTFFWSISDQMKGIIKLS